MFGSLTSQLKEEHNNSSRQNPCNPLMLEIALISQCSVINNWKHTYVGWMA